MPTPDWYHPVDFADLQLLRRVSLTARWVLFETFGGELGTKTGLVDCRPALIASECALDVASVEAALRELVDVGIVVWCPQTRIAYHRGHLLRHGATNPKHRAGWESTISAMPDCDAKACALSELYGEPWQSETRDAIGSAYPIETLSIGSGTGTGTGTGTGGVVDHDQRASERQATLIDTRARPARKARKPRAKRTEPDKPESIEDVETECKRLGVRQARVADFARAFVAYWTDRDWHRATGPVGDWKATLRNHFHDRVQRDSTLRERSRSAFGVDSMTDDERQRINREAAERGW